jgi:predicted NUDIX family NTP pyrophosphohydrolase
MARRSAGLLMFRRRAGGIELLLAHPGGPFWAKKDLGAWTLPKGEYGDSETALAAAQREFREETGWEATPPFFPLGSLKQRSGKVVSAWAFEGDADPATLVSNTIAIEWPPRSGRMQVCPEVDRADWFEPGVARRKILPGQAAFIDALERLVAEAGHRP